MLIEATSGNTGIALAMIAALKGYQMKLLMPDNMSQERRAAMRAYGAELILVTKEQGMEGARDLAAEMAQRGEGRLLDQFNNPDNPYAHYTHHRAGNLAADRWAHQPFCLQHGDDRYDYRRFTLPARAA
ncbi:Cysteine synthase B [Raoultella terrigena]|uniref:Cysteine synthase B n=1 Tax=Raoultella terrigena TaxID=577 RepID=A0A3P8ITL6_RAOTE|nr:Cysteine synthase B [Raoultella terrigena]